MFEEVKEAVGYIIAGLLTVIGTIFGWSAKRQVERIDALEKNSATREEVREMEGRLEKRFDASAEDRRNMHKENQDALKRIEERLWDVK